MTPQQAAEILDDHNAWRRGQYPYDGEWPPAPKYGPKEIGQAIDVAIKEMTK